jgi:hypothetical protein
LIQRLSQCKSGLLSYQVTDPDLSGLSIAYFRLLWPPGSVVAHKKNRVKGFIAVKRKTTKSV